MLEIALIDVLSGMVQVGDRTRDGAGQADAKKQRNQFDEREYDRHYCQKDKRRTGKLSATGEKSPEKNRRPSFHAYQFEYLFTGLPFLVVGVSPRSIDWVVYPMMS